MCMARPPGTSQIIIVILAGRPDGLRCTRGICVLKVYKDRMTPNLAVRLIWPIRFVRLMVNGFQFRMIQKKIFERSRAQYHLPAGNSGNEMHVIGPLIFVLDKPGG